MEKEMYINRVSINEAIEIDTNQYPFSLPSLQKLTELTFHAPVTFFVGENGSGKSTLLEAIAIKYGFNPEGGSKNFNFVTRNTHSSFHEILRLQRSFLRPRDGFFLRAESFYNVASEIDMLEEEGRGLLASYGGVSLHNQSHGESFLALMIHRFFGNGLYLLDEPEAALSPMRQLTLLSRIHQLVRQQSQFIIATHSPIVLAYPEAEIFLFDETGISLTTYQQTEHYQISKQFFESPERMLHVLLAEE